MRVVVIQAQILVQLYIPARFSLHVASWHLFGSPSLHVLMYLRLGSSHSHVVALASPSPYESPSLIPELPHRVFQATYVPRPWQHRRGNMNGSASLDCFRAPVHTELSRRPRPDVCMARRLPHTRVTYDLYSVQHLSRPYTRKRLRTSDDACHPRSSQQQALTAKCRHGRTCALPLGAILKSQQAGVTTLTERV